MSIALLPLFDGLALPAPSSTGAPLFSVASLADHARWFVGKDSEGKACILVEEDRGQRIQAPIRLERLEVLFAIPSFIRTRSRETQGTFTIIRSRATDRESNVYFLSVGETILRLLSPSPGPADIAAVIHRLAFIFRKLQQPPARTVNGLFGELFLIRQSRNPIHALRSWRAEHVSRFDFSSGDVRIDVKTATGRSRVHHFAFDQSNPPAGTIALAASLFAERSPGGLALHDMVRDVEQSCAAAPDLLVRLHDILAETLGTTLPEALALRFDQRLAETTLEFYDLRQIPAIRIAPPAGVTDIRFRSDLSGIAPAALGELLLREPALAEFLTALRA